MKKQKQKHSKPRTSLALLARMICSQNRIRVVIDRSVKTACADAQGVIRIGEILPVVDNERAEQAFVGKLLHECMHCVLTDYSVFGSIQGAVTKSLWNVIEDVWGEREFALGRPGAPRKIGAALDVMVEEGLFTLPPPTPLDPAAVLISFVLILLRARVAYQAVLVPMVDPWRMKFTEVFGPELTSAVEAKALEVDTVKGSRSALQLAEEILAIVKLKAEEEEPSEEAHAASEVLKAEDDQRELPSGDLGDQLESVQDDSSPTASSEIRSTSTLVSINAYTQALIERMRGSVGRRLESLIEAKVEEAAYTTSTGRRFDGRWINRMVSGNANMFRKNDEMEGLNTAVSLLIDVSGSMGNDHPDQPFGKAVAAAYAVTDVLNRFDGVATEVSAFGSTFCRIKSFDQNWVITRSLVSEGLGGTSTGPSLMKTLPSLMAQPHDRKIMVLITDGEPDDLLSTLAALETSQRLGVEPRVLFIGKRSGMKDLRTPSALVTSADEIPTALFDMFETAFA